jgi:hypothetical protein
VGVAEDFPRPRTAFSEIYDTSAENSFLDQLSDGVVNAVLLGEGGPSPKTSEDDQRLGILAQLHRERDRRQSLQHEIARCERHLSQSRAAAATSAVTALTERNRLLRRRLRWEEESLPVRVLLGAKPAFTRESPLQPTAGELIADESIPSRRDTRTDPPTAEDSGRSP